MPINYLPKIRAFRYGNTGKAYKVSEFGKKGARNRAKKQGVAIELSNLRGKGRVVERGNEIVQVKASRRAKGYERRV